jgi:signal transduction histidine kinase
VEGVRRVRLVDLSLVALAALVGALFFADSLQAAQPSPARVVDLTVGTLACLALLLRRRWPVALALVLMPVIIFSASGMGATAVAILSVASYRPWRVTAAVAGLHALFVTTLFVLAVESSSREFWQGLLVLLALDAAMVASGLLVRSQRLLVRSLEERAREAEEGHRLRIEEARHHERGRIAREMHDVLAHRISLLAVHAGALEVRRSAPEEERHAAGVIRQSAYEALEDLREVIGMLREPPGDTDPERPQPTLSDLPALIEESRLAGARVTLENRLALEPAVPESVGRHAYRIVQEGLTNARKHAPGAAVRVRLLAGDCGGGTEAGNGLIVEVANLLPERAIPAQIPGAGTGLIGLRERMKLIGGWLEHGRTPAGEFRLSAWLPWRA